MDPGDPVDVESSRGSGITQRIADAGCAINDTRSDRIDYLHSVLCQVGFPRRRTSARSFERRNGKVSLLVEAGHVYDGTGWKAQPLPYGPLPRLLMVHLSSEAVRTQSRVIDLGDSVRQFLLSLGVAPSGGSRGGYTAARKQLAALAACHVSIGMTGAERATTISAKPIERFEVWKRDGGTRGGIIELSEAFYSSLTCHAVPLDPRALAALRHSALALDVYAWLTHRLCRVKSIVGTMLSWSNLRDQFGQEYSSSKNFKREFAHALQQALVVYPGARVVQVPGGFRLYPSPAPVNTSF